MDAWPGAWKPVSILPSRYLVCLTDSATAVMLMETFDRVTRKDKYVWDVSVRRSIPSNHLLMASFMQIVGHVRHADRIDLVAGTNRRY